MKTLSICIMSLLLFSFLTGETQNMLADANFESSTPNGTWPSSDAWGKSWYPNSAGAVTTSTAALNGNSGLWIYTSTGNSFSRPYQIVKCEPSKIYKAQVWLRSPWKQAWTAGTKAYLAISFLNNYGSVIESAHSNILQEGNTGWKLYTVRLKAPETARAVKFEIILESIKGQSILNADNCFLSEL